MTLDSLTNLRFMGSSAVRTSTSPINSRLHSKRDIRSTRSLKVVHRLKRVSAPGATEVEFKNFLPRAILWWTPNESTTLYASYSKGVIPGDINQQFQNADAQEQAQYLAQFREPRHQYAGRKADQL